MTCKKTDQNRPCENSACGDCEYYSDSCFYCDCDGHGMENRDADDNVCEDFKEREEIKMTKEQFASTFPNGEVPTGGELVHFDFGEALRLLKQGKKVARKGWNGKGQFVYYVPADRYVAKTEAAKSVMDKDGKVSYRAYLALKTAQGDIATWVPSISDCLAEDWEVVE